MHDVQQILEEIEALPAAEQQRLHRALGARLGRSPMSEEEFADMLSNSGKLTRPERSHGTPADQRVKPIEISGEPLSETIIRERR